MIDYAMVSEQVKDKVKMRVVNTIESDLEPLEVEIQGSWECEVED